jgi:hypothetical protein
MEVNLAFISRKQKIYNILFSIHQITICSILKKAIYQGRSLINDLLRQRRGRYGFEVGNFKHLTQGWRQAILYV